MHINKITPTKIFGISLLEIMLSLTIIAAILVGVTRYYKLTRENLRITQAVEVVKNVASASYKWVEGADNFSQFNAAPGISILISTELLPSSYGTTIANPWHNGLITATADSSNDLIVSIPNVPTTSCNALTAKIKNSAQTVDCNGDGNTQTFSAVFVKP